LRPRLPLRAEAVAAEAATAEAAEAAEAAATPAPVLRQTLPHPHSNYPPVLQKRRPRPQRPPPPLPPPPRRPHQQPKANSESGVYLTRPLRPHFDRCLIRRHHWTLPARLPLRMTVREIPPPVLRQRRQRRQPVSAKDHRCFRRVGCRRRQVLQDRRRQAAPAPAVNSRHPAPVPPPPVLHNRRRRAALLVCLILLRAIQHCSGYVF
jgi:hypothetical protein